MLFRKNEATKQVERMRMGGKDATLFDGRDNSSYCRFSRRTSRNTSRAYATQDRTQERMVAFGTAPCRC